MTIALKPWREVAVPHEDVLEDTFTTQGMRLQKEFL